MINKLEFLLDKVFFIVGILEKILLSLMVLIICAQVFLRFADISLSWGSEVALIGMVWVTFLTLAIGVRLDIHIRIGMFVNFLPKKAKIILEQILNIAMLFICLLMVIYGWKLTDYAFASTLPATKLPTAVVYGVVPVVGVICVLQLIVNIFSNKRSDAAEEFINGFKEEGAK